MYRITVVSPRYNEATAIPLVIRGFAVALRGANMEGAIGTFSKSSTWRGGWRSSKTYFNLAKRDIRSAFPSTITAFSAFLFMAPEMLCATLKMLAAIFLRRGRNLQTMTLELRETRTPAYLAYPFHAGGKASGR